MQIKAISMTCARRSYLQGVLFLGKTIMAFVGPWMSQWRMVGIEEGGRDYVDGARELFEIGN